MFNAGATPLTDLILEISILEKSALNDLARKAIVRPFKIRGDLILQAGYTVNYSMLRRNLASDYSCMATVEVVSVDWLPETAP